MSHTLDKQADSRGRIGPSLRTQRALGWSARVIGWGLFALLWVMTAALVPKIPGPGAVVASMAEEFAEGDIMADLLPSLERFAWGMLLSVLIGVAVGLIMGSVKVVDFLLTGTMVASLAIPSVIWALMAIMWFGFGDTAPVVAVVLSAAPFVSANVATGVREMPKDLARMSRTFRVPAERRVRHLLIPGVAGHVFAGTRMALIIGWQALLLAEWFGSAEGVGYRARYWYDAHRLELTLGWIALFMAIVLLVDRAALEWLYRRVFRWRTPQLRKTEEN